MTDAPDEVIYRHATYATLVGSTFTVERPGGDHVAVELVGTTELPGRGECFSLVFRAPADVALDQRTYSLEHREIGAFSLFLVPLGPDGNGAQELEAIINRLEG